MLLFSIVGLIYYTINNHFERELYEIRHADSLLTISLKDSIRVLQTSVDSLKNIPPEIIVKTHIVHLPGTTSTVTIYDTILVYPFATDTKYQTFLTTNTFYDKKVSLFGKNTITSKVIVYSDSLKKEWFIKNDIIFKQDSLDILIDKSLFSKKDKFQILSGIGVGKRYNDENNAIDINISLGALIYRKYYGGLYVSPNSIGLDCKLNLSEFFKK